MTTARQLAEKAVWTYIQALLALVLAANGIAGASLSFTTAMAVAALPAALTVIANGLPQVSGGLPFATDLTFRVIRSFAAAFLGFLLAMPVFTLDWSSGKAALLAGLTAALAVVKGAAASRIGDSSSPAIGA